MSILLSDFLKNNENKLELPDICIQYVTIYINSFFNKSIVYDSNNYVFKYVSNIDSDNNTNDNDNDNIISIKIELQFGIHIFKKIIFDIMYQYLNENIRDYSNKSTIKNGGLFLFGGDSDSDESETEQEGDKDEGDSDESETEQEGDSDESETEREGDSDETEQEQEQEQEDEGDEDKGDEEEQEDEGDEDKGDEEEDDDNTEIDMEKNRKITIEDRYIKSIYKYCKDKIKYMIQKTKGKNDYNDTINKYNLSHIMNNDFQNETELELNYILENYLKNIFL